MLVLPAGSEPAATIDDVPLDAPGREQLVAIVDVDNPQATPTTTSAPTTTAAPPHDCRPSDDRGAGDHRGPDDHVRGQHADRHR